MEAALKRRVRFGPFELDPRAGELHNNGQATLLHDQQLQVLLLLIQANGQIVTRGEIKSKLWPNDTVVEFDHSINNNIKNLRRILGDSAQQPRYIETIASRGYRLIMPVAWIEGEAVSGEELADDSSQDAGSDSDTETTPKVRLKVGRLTGKTVSHYRVLEVIGGGGMGLVYRAEDVRLGRAVALKFLPEEVGDDPTARERFNREAHAVSTLDHPNICTVYDLDEHEGHPFITMQLLQGKTLREHLAEGRFRLSQPEGLAVAIQIAMGLEAAHEKGIIHRDIKPANIFITEKGIAKILDFGVAKILDVKRFEYHSSNEARSAANDHSHPTDGGPNPGSSLLRLSGGAVVTSADDAPQKFLQSGVALAEPARGEETLTRTGMALGTAGYMSPEQIRGEALDARTDIFSFGLVLYEMAAGHRAFDGDTAPEVRRAVLNDAPARLREGNSELPTELEAVVARCIQKEPEHRFHSAAEVEKALTHIRARTEHGSLSGKRKLWLMVAAIALLAIIAAWVLYSAKNQPAAKPDMLVRQLAANTIEDPVSGGSISPDGARLAYSSRNGVNVLQIDGGLVKQLPGTAGLQTIRWLGPDHILALKEGAYWEASAVDGSTARFQPQEPAVQLDEADICVSGDGALRALPEANGIRITDGAGQQVGFIGMEWPWEVGPMAWSPSGTRLVYVRWRKNLKKKGYNYQMEVLVESSDIQGKNRTTVLSEPEMENSFGFGSLVWLADGRLIFSSREPSHPDVADMNLWTILVRPDSGKVVGKPERLTNWTGFSHYELTASISGKRLVASRYQTKQFTRVADLRADGTASMIRTLQGASYANFPYGWVNDDKVLLTGMGHGQEGLYAQGILDPAPTPFITSTSVVYYAPAISPDHKWLLYMERQQETSLALMRMPLQGGPSTYLMPGVKAIQCPEKIGLRCIVWEDKNNVRVFSWLDPVYGLGAEIARGGEATRPEASLRDWSLSDDAARLAWIQHGSPQSVHLLEIETGKNQVITIPKGTLLQTLQWSPDSKHLYVSGNADGSSWGIFRMDLNGKLKTVTQVPGDRGWVVQPLPSPDGKHLVYSERDWQTDIVMLENF